MSEAIKVALISGGVGIVTALIAGLFTVWVANKKIAVQRETMLAQINVEKNAMVDEMKKQLQEFKDELSKYHAESIKDQAVLNTKVTELTREVREHNNFAHRVPILEEQMKVMNHRVSDLEK